MWRPRGRGVVGLVYKARGTGVSGAWDEMGGRQGRIRQGPLRSGEGWEGLFEIPWQPWMGFRLRDSTAQVAFQEVVLTMGWRTGWEGNSGSKEAGEVTVESGPCGGEAAGLDLGG